MSKKRISVIGVLLVLFILLVVLIKTGNIVNFDNKIYSLVTSNMNDTLTSIYKVFTLLGSTGFIIGLCALFLAIFMILKKNKYGYTITGVLVISTLVNNVVKWIIRRNRPEVLKLVVEKTFSFPSGHTMAAVSMYGFLIYLINKSNINKTYKIIISIILGIIPIMVAISRVYLGAHFASDVIGAAIMSTMLLLVETYYIDKKNIL